MIEEKWIPHNVNAFKFNVDGSTMGNLANVGIGGVIRDSSGRVVVLFSTFIGIQDALTTEI